MVSDSGDFLHVCRSIVSNKILLSVSTFDCVAAYFNQTQNGRLRDFSFSSACGYSALFVSENINAMSSFVTGQQTGILPTMFVDWVGGRNLSR